MSNDQGVEPGATSSSGEPVAEAGTEPQGERGIWPFRDMDVPEPGARWSAARVVRLVLGVLLIWGGSLLMAVGAKYHVAGAAPGAGTLAAGLVLLLYSYPRCGGGVSPFSQR